MKTLASILSLTCRQTKDCMNVEICIGILGLSLRPNVVGHARIGMYSGSNRKATTVLTYVAALTGI